jgi:uncharacterized protein (UPF0333 family)
MAALELLLLLLGILLGIICAVVPYYNNISNAERINFGALPP